MIKLLPVILGFSALLVFQPEPVEAQGARTWEFGVDFGFSLTKIDDVDDNLLSVGLPATDFGGSETGVLLQNVRVGYNVSKTFGVEGGLGFSYAKWRGDSLWRLGFSLDGLYNFPTESDTRWFLRGGGLVSLLGFSSETYYRTGLGAGGGVRMILGSQWGLRFEVGGSRLFENDDFYAAWNITGTVGFSFFTM